ncbi:uncharacterized protein B0J16DRAFT_386909 [Fusarium flagelliforme]|uniref:uncharacterized protein n=1 Tax=Fusarium flagelliforme TaxID=2675880 RepID=UPI001E8D7643|nr:uncharacterized protein B0J16DRAFT_386909 [Fusarium flagelliforme]KAH7179091.1 hypothetical protein B0J16DRAFT_386909 [Fusarium flagelliforme]
MEENSMAFMDSMCDFGNLNSEPAALWHRWSFASEPSYHGSYPHHQGDPHHGSVDMGQFMPDFSHGPSPTLFFDHNALGYQPPPISDPTQHGPSANITESPIYHSPIQYEAKKQKVRHGKRTSVTPPSRRNSTKKHQTQRVSVGEINMNTQEHEEQSESPQSEIDTQAKIKKRESNRRAAIKVQSKKRVLEESLETTEKGMEKAHRELTAQVKGLTDEIHNLKMQLLQHVGCECVLIQEYIHGEANRYIQDISGESGNSTRVS